MEAAYVIVDAFPATGADPFPRFSCGAVGCWIRPDLASDEATIDALVRDKLATIGWEVAGVIQRELVSDETYATHEEGRDHFEQMKLDGFVAHLDRVERRRIGAGGLVPDERLAAALAVFAAAVARDGAHSLYSERDEQWALGKIDGEDEYLPLWTTWAGGSRWSSVWPGYQPRKFATKELISDVLPGINADEMLVALALADRELVTFHPLQLKAAIEAELAKGERSG